MRINPCGITKLAGEDWLWNEASQEVTDNLMREIQSQGGSCELRGSTIKASEFPINDRTIPLNIQVYDREYAPGEFVVLARLSHNGVEHPVPIVDKVTTAEQIIRAIQKGFNALLSGRMPERDR